MRSRIRSRRGIAGRSTTARWPTPSATRVADAGYPYRPDSVLGLRAAAPLCACPPPASLHLASRSDRLWSLRRGRRAALPGPGLDGVAVERAEPQQLAVPAAAPHAPREGPLERAHVPTAVVGGLAGDRRRRSEPPQEGAVRRDRAHSRSGSIAALGACLDERGRPYRGAPADRPGLLAQATPPADRRRRPPSLHAGRCALPAAAGAIAMAADHRLPAAAACPDPGCRAARPHGPPAGLPDRARASSRARPTATHRRCAPRRAGSTSPTGSSPGTGVCAALPSMS